MTEETESMTEAPDENNPTNGAGTDRSTKLPSMTTITAKTEVAILAGLVLLAAFAAIQLYFSLTGVISYWIAPKYEPLFRSGLNLSVLLLAATGISVMLRRRANR